MYVTRSNIYGIWTKDSILHRWCGDLEPRPEHVGYLIQKGSRSLICRMILFWHCICRCGLDERYNMLNGDLCVQHNAAAKSQSDLHQHIEYAPHSCTASPLSNCNVVAHPTVPPTALVPRKNTMHHIGATKYLTNQGKYICGSTNSQRKSATITDTRLAHKTLTSDDSSLSLVKILKWWWRSSSKFSTTFGVEGRQVGRWEVSSGAVLSRRW
jgi:hypothetical protein